MIINNAYIPKPLRHFTSRGLRQSQSVGFFAAQHSYMTHEYFQYLHCKMAARTKFMSDCEAQIAIDNFINNLTDVS